MPLSKCPKCGGERSLIEDTFLLCKDCGKFYESRPVEPRPLGRGSRKPTSYDDEAFRELNRRAVAQTKMVKAAGIPSAIVARKRKGRQKSRQAKITTSEMPFWARRKPQQHPQ